MQYEQHEQYKQYVRYVHNVHYYYMHGELYRLVVFMGRVSSPESVVGAKGGEWGQSREGIAHPDCLVEETVFESASFGLANLQSPLQQL